MLTKFLALAFLPAIAYSRIVITIKANPNAAKVDVDVNGDDIKVVTDTDRDIFKINDETLKNASEIYEGKRCSHIYLKPSTRFGNVYKQYGWEVVKSKLIPFEHKVIGINGREVTLGIKEYVNSRDKDATYSMKIVKDIIETASHTLTKGEQIGNGRDIEYHINFGENSVGRSRWTYSAPWGKDPSKSRIVTVGKTTIGMATIPPGGKIWATLKAIQYTAEVDVRYEAILNGEVFCNYQENYNGHHYYAIPLKQLQNTAGTPRAVYATEKISLNFFANVKLEMSNGTI